MTNTSRALLLSALASFCGYVSGNTTESWLAARANLIHQVYGKGPGVLPTQSVPDRVDTWKENPGLQGLVWNMTTMFEIESTVFYSQAVPGRKAKEAFMFHHGHSNCVCKDGKTPFDQQKCRPGCISSMPSASELEDPGYTWWDLYNVSNFFHSQGYDVFILSMPLKGINLGPGSTPTKVNSDHWWFEQWEEKGDYPLRYFLEPAVLTANYAFANGYEKISMSGLSGGGWSTTFASAIDKRISASFPIAGSVPCAMRNPNGKIPGQNWTGDDQEDYEQNCSPNPNPNPKLKPGRLAFQACNYTCQYLLAGLEEDRFQVQILHERDSCCFSPQGRHDQMLAYERNIRHELNVQGGGKHGWFTSTADNHTKHEVCAQDKSIISAAMKGNFAPGSDAWQKIPCDIMHQPVDQPGECAPNVEPGSPGPEPPAESGYTFVGLGACRDADGKYGVWGVDELDNTSCEFTCNLDPKCAGYMSTAYGSYCQYFCSSPSPTCPNPGDGGTNTISKADNSSSSRYCWKKSSASAGI